MVEVLEFIFQDFTHYIGTLVLIIVICAGIADIGKAFVRDYEPKTYIFQNDKDNKVIKEEDLDNDNN